MKKVNTFYYERGPRSEGEGGGVTNDEGARDIESTRHFDASRGGGGDVANDQHRRRDVQLYQEEKWKEKEKSND